jgi:pantetheine-phosphate adenylyltransferase
VRARWGRVALGGTFDRLHVGHEALLATAFRSGRDVVIGLTTDRYLGAHPKGGGRPVRPFATRRAALRRYLARAYRGRRWGIVALHDRFGRAVEPGIDALVVSAESLAGGEAVNAERRRRGLASLPLVAVPLVLADDLEPVSATRIHAGVIDPSGRRRTPIAIAVRMTDSAHRGAVERAVRTVFPHSHLLDPGRGTPASDGLALTVRKRSPRGWTVRVASSRVRLDPVVVRAPSERALQRAVRRALRPSERKGL